MASYGGTKYDESWFNHNQRVINYGELEEFADDKYEKGMGLLMSIREFGNLSMKEVICSLADECLEELMTSLELLNLSEEELYDWYLRNKC